MNTLSLKDSPVGHLVPIREGHFAFVPNALPREIHLDSHLVHLLDEAARAVGTLQGVGETLPNPDLLIQPFVRREAVLSSRIEGTQTLLTDLLLYEASNRIQDPKGDAREVLNYVRALHDGISLTDTLPISTRFTNTIHARLLDGARGEDMNPGHLRAVQVIIGGESGRIEDARFIPPPANLVPDLMGEWAEFVNAELEMPPLIRCALMHYQFEAIHPYQDGNGRLGRLLIVLLLHATGVLTTPLLYLSGYFEKHRGEYMDQLLNVSITGDWRPWLAFFLEGVAVQAKDALLTSRRLRKLHDDFRQRLLDTRESANAFKLLDMLFQAPFTSPPLAAIELGLSRPGARQLLDRLTALDILQVYSAKRPRFYVSRDILSTIQS